MPSSMKCIVFFILICSCFGTTFTQVPDYETTSQTLPHTSFTCQGRPPGYYADVETGCRTYHVCDGTSHFTYICPRRTLFQQKMRICDHSYLVNCEESYLPEEEEYYPQVVEEEDITFRDYTDIFNTTTEPITVLITQKPKSYPPTTVTSPPPTTTITQPITTNIQPSDYLHPTTKKYLKLQLKDLRSLFYIPEIDNNSIIRKPIAEYLLPVGSEIKFKRRTQSPRVSHCPGYCNPKFFVLGTCHPCIMLK